MAMHFPQAKIHACDDPKMIPMLRVWACDGECGPVESEQVHEDIISIERCATCDFVKSSVEGVKGIIVMRLNPLTNAVDVVLDARP